MGKEQGSLYYDRVFKNAPYYHMPWDKMNQWTIIWEKSLPLLIENKVNSILDIGSGMGQFGQLVQSNNIKYKGIDFSEYAIKYSNENKVKNEVFEQADALKYNYEKDDVDCYVTHEFLEHIHKDTEILSKLKSNKFIIFSVPSFDDPGHVRWFNSIDSIKNRYSPYIKNLKVKAITDKVHYLGWGFTK